jgi:hypothetical protein
VYFHEFETIVISEKSLEILTPDEFKALMAHELDHHARSRQIFRMDEARDKIKMRGAEKLDVIVRAMELFDDYIEFSADNAAAKHYGAKLMVGALKKLLIAGVQDLPIVRHNIFPEIPLSCNDTISKDAIEERIEQMAEGAYKPKGWVAEHTFRRFERLRKQEIEGKY